MHACLLVLHACLLVLHACLLVLHACLLVMSLAPSTLPLIALYNNTPEPPDLVGEGEEPLPGRASIVQPLLPSEHYVEPATKVLGLEPHDLSCACVCVVRVCIHYAPLVTTANANTPHIHNHGRIHTWVKDSSNIVSLETVIFMCCGSALDCCKKRRS